jgi:hypothetical protein
MPYAAWRAIWGVAKHGEIRSMLEQFPTFSGLARA